MRFLIDESTGQSVVQRLRQLGHDVAAVAEEMPQASDDLIIIKALAEDRILITKLWLRIAYLSPTTRISGRRCIETAAATLAFCCCVSNDDRAVIKTQVAESVIQRFGDQLHDNFTVATQNRVRIRRPW